MTRIFLTGGILTLYSHNVQKYCARERMTSNGTSASKRRQEEPAAIAVESVPVGVSLTVHFPVSYNALKNWTGN